jgi:hypothetical protein
MSRQKNATWEIRECQASLIVALAPSAPDIRPADSELTNPARV